jgi:hypothetical protein
MASNSSGRRLEVTKSGSTATRIDNPTIPNHRGDLPEGTLRAILKQAGIEPDDFLCI